MTEISIGQDPSIQEALSQPFGDHNVEVLRNAGEVGQHFADLYVKALDVAPELAEVTITAADSTTIPILAHTGGMARHQSYSETGRPEVAVNTGDGWEHFEHLADRRPISAKVSAEKAGIDPEAITPKELAGFIFLHELGHIKYYLNEAPDVEAYKAQRGEEMKTLPIPGYNPAQLIRFLESPEGADWMKTNEGALSAGMGVQTAEDLLYLQEAAYHDLPTEDYPDRFAASVLNGT